MEDGSCCSATREKEGSFPFCFFDFFFLRFPPGGSWLGWVGGWLTKRRVREMGMKRGKETKEKEGSIRRAYGR